MRTVVHCVTSVKWRGHWNTFVPPKGRDSSVGGIVAFLHGSPDNAIKNISILFPHAMVKQKGFILCIEFSTHLSKKNWV